MKKISLILFSSALVVFQSCHSNEQPKEETPATSVIVGADADAHGCKASAGYTWSELKQNCIRIFEDGVQMIAVDTSLNQSLAAYIVFNADSSKGELFIPNVSNSVLLAKASAQSWADSIYQLSVSDKHLVLKKGTTTLYQSH